MSKGPFSSSELLGAISLACLVQAAIVGLTLWASHERRAPIPPPPREIAVAIQPVADLPLLKKGGKKDPLKLPDMVKKPKPVKRYEKVATASTKANKKQAPEVKPRPPKKDEPPPPDDAKQAARVDEMIRKMREEAATQEPNLSEEGAADGMEDGTEADPLKARAVDVYRSKLIQWFKRGFHPPVGQVDCETLKSLRARVTAKIGADRSVLSYTMVPSGNELFDARVRSRMQGTIGQRVPPPPPNYPELLTESVQPTFSGKDERCK